MPLSFKRGESFECINHNRYNLLKCNWCSSCFIFHNSFCRVVIGQLKQPVILSMRVSLYPYFLFRTESVESYNNVFMPQEKKFCNFLNLQEITGAKIVCIFNCKDSARPDQLSVPCTLLLDNSSVNLSYLRDRPEELKSMTRD